MIDSIDSSQQNLALHHERNEKFTIDVYWAASNVDKKVCRLNNGCIKRDGTLVLHSGHRFNEKVLRLCHVYNFSFEKLSSFSSIVGIQSDYILIGSVSARFHIPHFLTDMLSAIYATELLWPTAERPKKSYNCLHPSNNNCSEHMKKVNNTLGTQHTALLVENRVLEMPLDEWVPQFASLLINNPRLVSLTSLFKGQDKGKMICFKSIIAYKAGNYKLDQEWFDENNRFFRENRLRRNRLAPKLPHDAYQSNRLSEKSHGDACSLTILILNRSISHKRSLLRVAEIQTKISKGLNNISEMKIRAKIIVSYFEDLSFKKQIKMMQAADVIIGVHGAALANLIFAKKKTYFLEVFPVLYYAGPFKILANTMGMQYDSFIANPDYKSYITCIDHIAMKTRDQNLRAEATTMWYQGIRKRTSANISLDFSKFKGPRSSSLRLCARQQQLQVDVDKLIRIPVEMTRRFCHHWEREKISNPGT